MSFIIVLADQGVFFVFVKILSCNRDCAAVRQTMMNSCLSSEMFLVWRIVAQTDSAVDAVRSGWEQCLKLGSEITLGHAPLKLPVDGERPLRLIH